MLIRKMMVSMMCIVFFTRTSSLGAMHRKKILSAEEISNQAFLERWSGLEERALKTLAQEEHNDGSIEVMKDKELLALFDIRQKIVITYFKEGLFVVSYKEFERRFRPSSDTVCNYGSMCGEQFIPVQQQKEDDDEQVLATYQRLADNVGQHSKEIEDLLALQKKKKRCCCILN